MCFSGVILAVLCGWCGDYCVCGGFCGCMGFLVCFRGFVWVFLWVVVFGVLCLVFFIFVGL